MVYLVFHVRLFPTGDASIDAWLMFFGSFIGGIAGAMIAIFGVWFTIKNNRTATKEMISNNTAITNSVLINNKQTTEQMLASNALATNAIIATNKATTEQVIEASKRTELELLRLSFLPLFLLWRSNPVFEKDPYNTDAVLAEISEGKDTILMSVVDKDTISALDMPNKATIDKFGSQFAAEVKKKNPKFIPKTLRFKIKNYGKNLAANISIQLVHDPKSSTVITQCGPKNLEANEAVHIVFFYIDEIDTDFPFFIRLFYDDLYGNVYSQVFEVKVRNGKLATSSQANQNLLRNNMPKLLSIGVKNAKK